jgi:hypothetical protein
LSNISDPLLPTACRPAHRRIGSIVVLPRRDHRSTDAAAGDARVVVRAQPTAHRRR